MYYPGQVPVLKADEVEETVVRVTGVDPVVGVNPVPGSKRKSKAIVLGKDDFCTIKRVPGTQFGESSCHGTQKKVLRACLEFFFCFFRGANVRVPAAYQ